MDAHAAVLEQCGAACGAPDRDAGGPELHDRVRLGGLALDGGGSSGAVSFAGEEPDETDSAGSSLGGFLDPRLLGGTGIRREGLAGSCGILPPRGRTSETGEAVGCCINDYGSRSQITEEEYDLWVISGAFPLLQPNWRLRKSDACRPAADDCDVCPFPDTLARRTESTRSYLGAMMAYAEETRDSETLGGGGRSDPHATIEADEGVRGLDIRSVDRTDPSHRMQWVAYSGLSYLVGARTMVDWAMCLHRVPDPVRGAINGLLSTLRELADQSFPKPGLRFVPVESLWVGGRTRGDGQAVVWKSDNSDVLRVRAVHGLSIEDIMAVGPSRLEDLSIVVDVVSCHPLIRRWYSMMAPFFTPDLRPSTARLLQHRCASVGFAYQLLLGLFEALIAGSPYAPWWHWGAGAAPGGGLRPAVGYAAMSSTCSRFVRAANAFLWAATTQDSGSRAMMAESACSADYNDRCLPYSDQIRVWPTGCGQRGTGVIGRRDAPDITDGCPGQAGTSGCDQVRWVSHTGVSHVFGPANPGACAWPSGVGPDLEGDSDGPPEDASDNEPRAPWD